MSYDLVGQFHAKFGLPHARDGAPPAPLDASTLAFRIAFMLEELQEFTRAASQGDLAKMLDALVDLDYVVKGTAHFLRFPFDEAFAEVHAANMRKVRADGANDARSVRGHSADVVKPRDWTAPDIEGVLERYREELRRFGAGLSERAIG